MERNEMSAPNTSARVKPVEIEINLTLHID
jgi:hypothetical protein